MATGDIGLNPATATLSCRDPFEVLRLSPGVYTPEQVKKRYRRIALLLHPDKNRHPDAESAFKKLTSAFERLCDPAKQAVCREEANRAARAGPSGGNNRTSKRPGTGPEWCREGEYKQEEQERGRPAPDSARKEWSVKDFWEEFQRQEKMFVEEVAKSKEQKAEKKRVKAEEVKRRHDRDMERLREEVFGEGGVRIEENTASWKSFTWKKGVKRSRGVTGVEAKTEGCLHGKGDGGARETMAGDEKAGTNVSGLGKGKAGGGGGGDVAVGSGGEEVEQRGGTVCWVCRRAFKSVEGLKRHEAVSELHAINVELKNLMSMP